jgi:hypothetical protein
MVRMLTTCPHKDVAKEWLLSYGEVQAARIFFNHHIPNANPYEDKWTLWQAYSQVGSSETGWLDILAGRQALRFGDERVIGPSEWLNVGRTFNVARVDLHHPGYEVSVFASSVVPGDNSDITPCEGLNVDWTIGRPRADTSSTCGRCQACMPVRWVIDTHAKRVKQNEANRFFRAKNVWKCDCITKDRAGHRTTRNQYLSDSGSREALTT